MGRRKDSDYIEYEIDNDAGTILVRAIEHKLAIGFEDDQPLIRFGNVTVSYDREQLAKILWAAAYLVDSGEVWREDSYPARDYTHLN